MMKSRSAPIVCSFVIAILFLACFEDYEDHEITNPDGDAEADVEVDMNSDGDDIIGDGDLVDTDEEIPIEHLPCLNHLLLDTTFEPARDDPDTQIHPFTAFDGEIVWVAYNLPNRETSNFDIYLVRLYCDGAQVAPPFKVNTISINNIDPTISINGETVLVAWNGDTGEGIGNMNIYYRLFQKDSTPLSDEEFSLEPTRNGQSVSGNLLSPQLAALSNGTFALVGSWGIEEAQSWQVFLQIIDASGNPVGDAVDAAFLPETAQMNPSVVAAADGSIHISWTQSPLDNLDLNQVVYVKFAPQATQSEPSPPAVAADMEGSNGSNYSVSPDSSNIILAFQSEISGKNPNIHLMDGGDFNAEDVGLTLGLSAKFDHSPIVAQGESGGAVAWYRMISGIKSSVFVQRFDFDGEAFSTPGDPVRVNDGAAAGYFPTSITHIADNIYFIVWSEGNSPDFRVKARFVSP